MKFQRERSELMVIFTKFLNLTNTEMFKISIKTKQAWIWLLTNSNI